MTINTSKQSKFRKGQMALDFTLLILLIVAVWLAMFGPFKTFLNNLMFKKGTEIGQNGAYDPGVSSGVITTQTDTVYHQTESGHGAVNKQINSDTTIDHTTVTTPTAN